MGDVFILGAGFSRAVSSAMPDMKELSHRVRSSYSKPIPNDVETLLDENFELALSYLAQPKPWIPEAENLRHQALFLDLSNLIASVIATASVEAVSGIAGATSWLGRLIQYWHRNQCSVLTLNYDLLVEVFASGLNLGAEGQQVGSSNLYPPLFSDPSPRGGIISTWPFEGPTFQLLKLHGSVNLFYSGRPQASGEAIYHLQVWGGPSRFLEQPEARESLDLNDPRTVSDKVPFIVPPVFEKAPLFSHETVRSLWFQGARALEKATRLVCVGYSLPESDLTMRHFIRSSLEKSNAPVEIVNKVNMTESYERSLGLNRFQFTQSFSGDNCVRDFVASLPL